MEGLTTKEVLEKYLLPYSELQDRISPSSLSSANVHVVHAWSDLESESGNTISTDVFSIHNHHSCSSMALDPKLSQDFFDVGSVLLILAPTRGLFPLSEYVCNFIVIANDAT